MHSPPEKIKYMNLPDIFSLVELQFRLLLNLLNVQKKFKKDNSWLSFIISGGSFTFLVVNNLFLSF